MERKINFRGKRADNGEWAFGGFMLNKDKQPCILSFNPDDTLSMIIIDPASLGQFTGLHDIDNKPIFEDDILDTATSPYDNNGRKFLCKWIDSGFALIYQGYTYGAPENNPWMNRYPLCRKNVEDLQIIGNIYDTPEFIKSESK